MIPQPSLAQDSKRAKLVMLAGRKGWHSVSPLSITATCLEKGVDRAKCATQLHDTAGAVADMVGCLHMSLRNHVIAFIYRETWLWVGNSEDLMGIN